MRSLNLVCNSFLSWINSLSNLIFRRSIVLEVVFPACFWFYHLSWSLKILCFTYTFTFIVQSDGPRVIFVSIFNISHGIIHKDKISVEIWSSKLSIENCLKGFLIVLIQIRICPFTLVLQRNSFPFYLQERRILRYVEVRKTTHSHLFPLYGYLTLEKLTFSLELMAAVQYE